MTTPHLYIPLLFFLQGTKWHKHRSHVLQEICVVPDFPKSSFPFAVLASNKAINDRDSWIQQKSGDKYIYFTYSKDNTCSANSILTPYIAVYVSIIPSVSSPWRIKCKIKACKNPPPHHRPPFQEECRGSCQSQLATVAGVYLFSFAPFQTSNSLSALMKRGERVVIGWESRMDVHAGGSGQ